MEGLNKILSELDLKIGHLKEKEDNITHLFQKVKTEFSSSLLYLKRERDSIYKKYEGYSTSRLKTFEKIREVLKVIRLNEKKNEKISKLLKSLKERESVLVNEYNSLLAGATKNDNTVAPGLELYSIYETNKKFNKTNIQKKDDLNKRKKNLLDALTSSFNKIESELSEIDKHKERLKKDGNEILDILYKANKEHSESQQKYSAEIREIKRLKKGIKRILIEEEELRGTYINFLSSIKGALDLPKEIALKLLPILSKIEDEGKKVVLKDKEEEMENDEWIVEVEKVSTPNKLIEFPRAG